MGADNCPHNISKENKKGREQMKALVMVVVGLLMAVGAKAETQTLQVWGSGSVVYAQAVLGSPIMANHSMTARVRFVGPSGSATPWVSVTRVGATSIAT